MLQFQNGVGETGERLCGDGLFAKNTRWMTKVKRLCYLGTYWYVWFFFVALRHTSFALTIGGAAMRAQTYIHETKTLRQITIVLFVLTFVLRLGFGFFTHPDEHLYSHEVERVAQNLANTGVFGNPYEGCITGPTAHVAPGYPAVLSLIYRYADEPIRAIQVVSSAVAGLTYALLPWVAGLLGLNVWLGVGAGFFGALLPYLPGMEANGAWESVFVGALLVIALGLTGRYVKHRTAMSAVLAGFFWGIALLFGPALLPVLFVILFWLTAVLRLRKPHLVALGSAALLTVTPWIARNYVRFGHLFWIRSNFGLELEISNSDAALPFLDDNLTPLGSFSLHPGRSHGCQMIQSVGERQFMSDRLHEAEGWIGSHPRQFLELTAQRFWLFWSSPFPGWPRRLLALLTGVLAVVGCGLALRRNRIAAMAFVAVIGAFPLVYYFIQADARYRAPVQPVFLLAAAYALSELLPRRVSVALGPKQTSQPSES